MERKKGANRGLMALALFGVVILAGCGKQQVEASKAPAKAKAPGEIKANPALLKQLRVGEAPWSEVAGSLHVSGRVEANATHMARVGSPVKGRITDLPVMEGQHVKRGEMVAAVYSTDLSDAQFAFLKAVSQRHLAQRAAERAKQLLAADVIGSAEMQRREAEEVQAADEVSALQQQLASLGMSEAAIRELASTRKLNSKYQIMATISGTVLERFVTVGQIVQPAEVAFTIADLSSVWLVADVPEQNTSDLAVGKAVDAVIPAYPGEVISGRLSFVSATVNPETRTVRVRMDVPNPDGKYKPAMLTNIVVKDRAQREKVIPSTAIVREGNRDFVFVQTAPDTFRLRTVDLGEEAGDGRVLHEGVARNEKIVLDGAFHLNNERKRLAMEGGV
jgi:membrane fusion protein, heavy metal efflux system